MGNVFNSLCQSPKILRKKFMPCLTLSFPLARSIHPEGRWYLGTGNDFRSALVSATLAAVLGFDGDKRRRDEGGGERMDEQERGKEGGEGKYRRKPTKTHHYIFDVNRTKVQVSV